MNEWKGELVSSSTSFDSSLTTNSPATRLFKLFSSCTKWKLLPSRKISKFQKMSGESRLFEKGFETIGSEIFSSLSPMYWIGHSSPFVLNESEKQSWMSFWSTRDRAIIGFRCVWDDFTFICDHWCYEHNKKRRLEQRWFAFFRTRMSIPRDIADGSWYGIDSIYGSSFEEALGERRWSITEWKNGSSWESGWKDDSFITISMSIGP